MKNIENYQKASDTAMRIGMRFGIALIVLNLVKFHFRLEAISISFSFFMWVFNVLLYSAIIVYTIKHIRDSIFNGFIPYRGALSYGTGLIFFAAGVSALTSFVYFKWIDSYYLGWRAVSMYEMIIDFYHNIHAAEEHITLLEEMYENSKVPKPISGAFNQFIRNISLAFIISLIASIFLKKQPTNQQIQ